MRKVFVSYHQEDGSWWADSPDIAGFTAVGSSLAEVREIVRDGMDFYLEGEPARVIERTEAGVALNVESAVEVPVQAWWRAAAGTARGIALAPGGIGVSITSGTVATPA